MDHINLISFLCLLVLIVYTRFLIKQPEHIKMKIIKIQIFFVLAYNVVIHLLVSTKTPVELSTISYFVVPVILYLGLKKLNVWAVYASLMSGFFYYFSMVLAGNSMYGTFPAYSVLTSLYNHGTLMIYAFVILSTQTFVKKDRLQIWVGLALTIVFVLLVRPVVTHPGRIFIYEILEANVVNMYIPDYLAIGFVVYYILFVLFLYTSSNIVHWASKWVHPNK